MNCTRYLLHLLLVSAILITGCVTTTMQADWKNPAFSGSFKKILVISIIQDSLVRTTLEDDMATQFTARGIDTVLSYRVLPFLKNVDRESVKRKAIEVGADGVFLIRPISAQVSSISTYDLVDAVADLDGNGVGLTMETHRAQISLFETADGKLVWQAISDTLISGPWMQTIQDFTKVMGAKLIERGLI